jgi:hypothetical protein
MGVAALVLGIIALILAFFGGVGGIILGIAAVILGVLGRRAAERDGLPTGSATAGLVTGVIGILLGGLVFAACLKCASGCAEMARDFAQLQEAQGPVDEILRRQGGFYETEHVDAKGNLAPKRFVSAGPTPAKVPCQNKPVTLTAEDWQQGGWGPLQFSLEGPTPFQFQAVATGTGPDSEVIVIVRTDPSCKGVPVEAKQRMAIDEEGHPFVQHGGFSRGAPGSQPTMRRRPGRHSRPGVLAPAPAAPEGSAPAPDEPAPDPAADPAPGAPPAGKAPAAR